MMTLSVSLIKGALFVVPILLSSLIPALLTMLKPGSKMGYVTSQASKNYRGKDMEETKALILKRLNIEKFKVKKSDDNTIIAERATHRPEKSFLSLYPYEKLGMNVIVELAAQSDGTSARLSVTNKSWLIPETGEEAYMKVVALYLLGEDHLPEVEPDLQALLASAPWLSGQGIFIPWLIYLPFWPGEHAETAIVSSVVMGFAGVSSAAIGCLLVALKPTHFYGYLHGVLALVLTLIAWVSAGLAAYWYFIEGSP